VASVAHWSYAPMRAPLIGHVLSVQYTGTVCSNAHILSSNASARSSSISADQMCTRPQHMGRRNDLSARRVRTSCSRHGMHHRQPQSVFQGGSVGKVSVQQTHGRVGIWGAMGELIVIVGEVRWIWLWCLTELRNGWWGTLFVAGRSWPWRFSPFTRRCGRLEWIAVILDLPMLCCSLP
jgi:hypothetical protein